MIIPLLEIVNNVSDYQA